MGKGGTEEVKTRPVAPETPAIAHADIRETDEKESRFMAALQAMVGGTELTEEAVRAGIANLTPQQRQQLIAEGQGLKRDLLTKQEYVEDRHLYFREVNRGADQADLPVDKDGAFLAKKVWHAASNRPPPPVGACLPPGAHPSVSRAARKAAEEDGCASKSPALAAAASARAWPRPSQGDGRSRPLGARSMPACASHHRDSPVPLADLRLHVHVF